MNLRRLFGAGVVTATLALTATAGATVTFDSSTGVGFVGKGDVQYTFGWNNAQLQQNNSFVRFKYEASSTTVTEVSWICTNSKNEHTQERARTTETSSSTVGVLSSTARERNQITGFNLNGYAGAPTITSSSTTDGPPVNSCPNDNGNWSLTTPAGDPELISSVSTGGLQVSADSGATWTALLEKPVVIP